MFSHKKKRKIHHLHICDLQVATHAVVHVLAYSATVHVWNMDSAYAFVVFMIQWVSSPVVGSSPTSQYCLHTRIIMLHELFHDDCGGKRSAPYSAHVRMGMLKHSFNSYPQHS